MKLHAQTAHHENGQSHAHEVFVHHFRLPRRGEEMAHSDFCSVLHSKNPVLPRCGGSTGGAASKREEDYRVLSFPKVIG